MNTLLVNAVYGALEELEVEPFGYLEEPEDQHIFVFGTKLQGYEVTGALRIEGQGDDAYNKRIKFSICSDDDLYKEELGIDIALGRVMRMNDSQAVAGGDLALDAVTKQFVKGKLAGLENVLASKREAEAMLESLEENIYSEMSNRMEDYV